MTDFQKLADEIVEHGHGRAVDFSEQRCYKRPRDEGTSRTLSAENFCNDWRVAGAMMEKMSTGELTIWRQAYDNDSPVWIVETHLENADGRDESLPLAINEACCEALR